MNDRRGRRGRHWKRSSRVRQEFHKATLLEICNSN